MYGTVRLIADQFNIKPVNIYKCKYYYVINSTKGSFLLSAARPGKDRIKTIHYYKELLYKNGFYALDNYAVTSNNEPYVEYDGSVYTMSKYFGSTELDIMSNLQCQIALETIGAMAYATKNVSDERVYAANINNNLIATYQKKLNRLYKSKKMLNAQRGFDIKLNRYIQPIIKRAELSLNNLKKMDYGNALTICHNSLKEGNIIYNKGKCWLIDWDNMKMAHYLEDCSFFIKRYIRKNAFHKLNTKAEYMDLNQLLKHYTKNNKLDKYEEDILYELLSFPHRFINLVNEYCSKNRGFIPSGLANKLNECMEEWDFLYDYIG